MPHLSNPEAEAQLDVEHQVLDKGFIRMIDFMGGDQRIVDAARVSYQAGTQKVSTDKNLIRYLLRHKHTTPFEKIRFEFHIKIPIFVMRQWIRHRMSSTNEESARYSVMKDEFYIPEMFRKQSATNKQGSSTEVVDKLCHLDDRIHQESLIADPVSVTEYLENLCETLYGEYEYLLGNGVSREMARMILPVNLYTEFYWTVDLWNLMGFLKLRLDSHAQLEIQECARPLEMLASTVCPIAMEAWKDYIYDSKNMSRMEMGVLQTLVQQTNPSMEYMEALAKGSGMQTRTEKNESSREFLEFLEKLSIKNETSSGSTT